MNRIYKVIWSRARNCNVAASEFAKGRGKSSSSGTKKILAAALAALILTGAGTGISMAAAGDDVQVGPGATVSGITENTTGQIAIGKNAHVRVNNNGQEELIGIDSSRTNVAGGIAIGSNAYARTGSIMIGSHVYKGNMGDVQKIDTTTPYSGTRSGFNTTESGAYGHTVATTTIGTNSFTKGFLATTLGDYNIQSGRISSMSNLSSLAYGAQNFGATVIGALNSNESLSAPEASILSPSYSGIANSIIGTANRVNNSNGTLVFGAGNEVTNSLGTNMSGFGSVNLQNAAAAAANIRKAIKQSAGGGATVVIGGGNTVNNTLHTMITALNSTVSGTADTPSEYNLVNAFNTHVTNSSHIYTIGTNNYISNSSNSIVFGDGYNDMQSTAGGALGLTGLRNSVIIGNSTPTNPGYNQFMNANQVVSIGNGNVMFRTDGGVAIGSNNFMIRSGGAEYALGTGNVAIGENTYINSYASQGDSIAIGKRATVENMVGTGENRYAFGRSAAKGEYSGSIAIGENAYARSGSTMIGVHTYQGDLADMTISLSDLPSSHRTATSGITAYQTRSVNATTLGNESYNSGMFSTVTGSYSAATGNTDTDINHYTQNFGATINGSLNSIESYTSYNPNSGVASSILGTANRIANSSNTTVTGSGNVVTNSIAQTLTPTDSSVASARALQNSFAQSLQQDASGGIVVSGTGNTVDSATASSVIGSGNTVSSAKNITVIGQKNSTKGTADDSTTDADEENLLTNVALIGDNRTVGANGDNSIILGSADNAMTTNNKNVTILGYNANATVDGGIALGSGSIANTAAGIAGYDPLTRAVSTRTSDPVWTSTAGAVSVGSNVEGSIITRQITNVAAGTRDTDAVNMAQLRSAVAEFGHPTPLTAGDGITVDVNENGDYVISVNAAGGKTDTDTVAVTPKAASSSGSSGGTSGGDGSGSALTRDGRQLVITDTTNPTSFSADEGTAAEVNPGETLALNGDSNITTTAGSKKITVALNRDISVDSVTTGDTSMNSDGLTIADGPSVTKSGIDAGNQKITNVAAGTISADSRDAVNGSQLYDLGQDVAAIDNRVNNLSGRVSRLDTRINKVGAGAAALAALHPLDFNPDDKWDFAIGYGNYRNANAVAVGAFYRPNENTMFSVATNFGNGENMFNAGASFRFGGGSSYSGVSRAELAAENEQLKKNDALQDQKIQKQDQEIQELKQQLAELESRIK